MRNVALSITMDIYDSSDIISAINRKRIDLRYLPASASMSPLFFHSSCYQLLHALNFSRSAFRVQIDR